MYTQKSKYDVCKLVPFASSCVKLDFHTTLSKNARIMNTVLTRTIQLSNIVSRIQGICNKTGRNILK